MALFRKKEEVEAKEEKELGLVIQFTPVAVYVYVSMDGYIASYGDGSTLDMEDLEGNYIGINGTYITLCLSEESQIEEYIKKFGLTKADMPVIRINVRER